MMNRAQFEELVQSANRGLAAVASANRNIGALEETGPLDENGAVAVREQLPELKLVIDLFTQARNEMVNVWLRSGEDRAELSELTGIPIHELRSMSDAMGQGMDVL